MPSEVDLLNVIVFKMGMCELARIMVMIRVPCVQLPKVENLD